MTSGPNRTSGINENLTLYPDWEISGNATVEWYDCIHGEKTDPDYHSAIWLPVKRKAAE